MFYQALPLVFDHVSDESGHIIVVSLLVSLMEDQVKYLRSLGLSAVNISSNVEVDRAKIEKGEYSIVYGSPEAWLVNKRWRCILSNDVYSRKLFASFGGPLRDIQKTAARETSYEQIMPIFGERNNFGSLFSKHNRSNNNLGERKTVFLNFFFNSEIRTVQIFTKTTRLERLKSLFQFSNKMKRKKIGSS